MLVGQVVPEGLAAVPPGPALAAALAELDPAMVPNDDVVDVLIASSRQLAHDQARVFAVMNEVLHRLPCARPLEIRRGEGPGQFSADEVRAALVWTRRFADRETDLAFALVQGLPRVQQALWEGKIDRGKATVFAQHLVDLSEEQVEVICRRLVPVAGELTPWQLAERIKRLILELDPEFYERRYRKAVRDRKVIGYLDENGAAVITGSGLPARDAAAALERIDSLARAIRRAGHPHTLDQIRADVFLGLLDGSLHLLGREQIIAAFLDRAAGRLEQPGTRGEVDLCPAPAAGAAQHASPVAAAAVEIRVPLATVLGLDERAGDIPGWGPVSASVARATVARQRRAQWRWVVVDGEGRMLSDGITRRRPAGQQRTATRGGVVELQVAEHQLADLAAAAKEGGRWARVIADIASQHAGGDRVRDLDAHPEDRFPRAALRRHVQVRDRHCTFRGCRTPARGADQDHTLDHSLGGPTTADDLGPACRHDHTLKTEGGWTLAQPEAGVFVWTSPLGRVYPVRPEPILPPPPDPVVREPDPWHDRPADPTERPLDLGPRRRGPPPTPPTPHAGPRADLDDPPPF